MLQSFSGFILFGFISIAILAGIFLRAKISFFQKAMIPASLIGGFLGLALVSTGWIKFPMPNGEWYTVTAKSFLPFTFHAFNISFISLCLTRSEKKTATSKIFKGSMWMAMIWTACFSLQALVGTGTVWLYDLVTGSDISVYLGTLITAGFTQGPGQGIAIGTLWQNKYMVSDAMSMGLIWGTLGFVAAYFIGIPYAKRFVSRGENENKRSVVDDEFMTGLLKKETQRSAGRETTHSSNVDTLSLHLAMVGLAYVLAYVEISITKQYIHHFLFSYPIFFLHGLGFAVLIRTVMEKMGIGHLADPGVQKRITGASVDFLIAASIMGISMTIVTKYLGIIILLPVVVSLVTLVMVEIFRRRLKHLGPERAVSQFGCCCGSTASGLLLLRILDADYSTSVGTELAFFNLAVVVTTLPTISLLFPVLPGMGIWSVVLILAANTLVCLGLAHWFSGRITPESQTA